MKGGFFVFFLAVLLPHQGLEALKPSCPEIVAEIGRQASNLPLRLPPEHDKVIRRAVKRQTARYDKAFRKVLKSVGLQVVEENLEGLPVISPIQASPLWGDTSNGVLHAYIENLEASGQLPEGTTKESLYNNIEELSTIKVTIDEYPNYQLFIPKPSTSAQGLVLVLQDTQSDEVLNVGLSQGQEAHSPAVIQWSLTQLRVNRSEF